MNEFLTINNTSEGLYKEKGSKFLSFAFPVNSELEVSKNLSDLKKKYYDARHHCYAYIIGMKSQRYRANDDGEPNHSAGDPILGQIRSYNLTNVLVVVVRYFGGTKLGVGGLIHAYKTAAGEALSNSAIIKIFSKTKFRLVFSYDETTFVERILGEFEIEYEAKNFTNDCEYIGAVKDEKFAELVDKFELLEAKIISLKTD